MKKKTNTNTNTNAIDLQEEILLQVDGEEEKKHTLSWELLKKIGDNTQNLIDTLVKVSTEENKIPAELTKLIFVGFYPGSAIPAWKLPNFPNLMFPVEKEVKQLNSDLGFVLGSLNSGNFKAIADNYTEPSVKNLVIDAVYDFSNSVGTKPFRVVKRDETTKSGFKPVARIRKMTTDHKNQLYSKIEKGTSKIKEETIEAVAKVQVYKNKKGKLSGKKLQFYTEKNAALSIKIDHIETEKRVYLLQGEQSFSLIIPQKNSFIIESDLLDIYAVGETFKAAEEDFSHQFDYTYQRLTQIEDSKLSNHLLKAKKFITLLVDTVKDK